MTKVLSFTPQTLLPQGNNLQHPLKMKLNGSQSWCGQFGEEINLLLKARVKPKILRYPTRSLVILSSTLSGLLL
jgi:hypothetical protein